MSEAELSSLMILHHPVAFFFFFNDTATTEIYTLSLHDALPISHSVCRAIHGLVWAKSASPSLDADRKSTRLNSSHTVISYAVFCLKKKKIPQPPQTHTNKTIIHQHRIIIARLSRTSTVSQSTAD